MWSNGEGMNKTFLFFSGSNSSELAVLSSLQKVFRAWGDCDRSKTEKSKAWSSEGAWAGTMRSAQNPDLEKQRLTCNYRQAHRYNKCQRRPNTLKNSKQLLKIMVDFKVDG